MVESEIHGLIGTAAKVVTSRAVMTLGAKWATDAEFRLAVAKINEGYEAAFAAFQGQTIDHLIIGDAAFWMPMAGQRQLRDRLTAFTGKPPSLAAFAFLEAFRAIDARKIAIITPRLPKNGVVSGGIWEEEGLTVTGAGDLQCRSADDIASVTPERVEALAKEQARDKPDAIAVTGTNIALTGSIGNMRQAVGVPILHINDILAADALGALGLPQVHS